MKGRKKKQHLNRPQVRTRRADLLQCGPSQLAINAHFISDAEKQSKNGGGKKNNNFLPLQQRVILSQLLRANPFIIMCNLPLRRG